MELVSEPEQQPTMKRQINVLETVSTPDAGLDDEVSATAELGVAYEGVQSSSLSSNETTEAEVKEASTCDMETVVETEAEVEEDAVAVAIEMEAEQALVVFEASEPTVAAMKLPTDQEQHEQQQVPAATWTVVAFWLWGWIWPALEFAAWAVMRVVVKISMMAAMWFLAAVAGIVPRVAWWTVAIVLPEALALVMLTGVVFRAAIGMSIRGLATAGRVCMLCATVASSLVRGGFVRAKWCVRNGKIATIKIAGFVQLGLVALRRWVTCAHRWVLQVVRCVSTSVLDAATSAKEWMMTIGYWLAVAYLVAWLGWRVVVHVWHTKSDEGSKPQAAAQPNVYTLQRGSDNESKLENDEECATETAIDTGTDSDTETDADTEPDRDADAAPNETADNETADKVERDLDVLDFTRVRPSRQLQTPRQRCRMSQP